MNESERPRAVVQRVDLSATHVVPVAARSSESALFHAYRGTKALEDRPCVCGGIVRADPERPAPGVAAHNHSPRHKAWRSNHEAELYAA